jgi:hypothetical protein
MANERDLKEPKYAWDPKANGKPKDWNEQETWCRAAYKKAEKKWTDKEIRTPSVSEFLDAFLETRTDETGTPVRRLLSNPRQKEGGWVRYEYVPPKPYHEMYPDAYNKDKKLKEGHWCQAVHGSNIAALYSILATGTIKESTTTEDGDRFFPTAPGAYCHGYDPKSQRKVKDLRQKADNYLTYWSPLDDGIYYAVKVDLDVDRDQGKIARGDQWVQPGDSTRITGICIHAVKWHEIPMNRSFTEGWDPLKESNYKKISLRAKPAEKKEEEKEEAKKKRDTEEYKQESSQDDAASKSSDADLNRKWRQVHKRTSETYTDKILGDIKIPQDNDWDFKDLDVQVYSCGYAHMENPSCTTATSPKSIVSSVVEAKLRGDYGQLNFNYVPHQRLIIESLKNNYSKYLVHTDVIFIDCRRIGKDLEETKNKDVMRRNTKHSGCHVNNLALAQKSERFESIFKEVAKKLRERRKDAKVSIVLLCKKGRHRSESVRCGLKGALTLAGATVSDTKPLCLPAWESLGCRRCDDCKYPDVETVRSLWLKCFNLIRPEGYLKEEVKKEPDKKGDKNKIKPEAKKMPDSRSQQETREKEEVKEEKTEKRKMTKDRPEKSSSSSKKHKSETQKYFDEDDNSEASASSDWEDNPEEDNPCKGKLDESSEEESVVVISEKKKDEPLEELEQKKQKEESRGSKESRASQEPIPLDVAYKVLRRLLACFRPSANYLTVAHAENASPQEAIWNLEAEEQLHLAIVPGMIKAALREHNMASEASSSVQAGIGSTSKAPPPESRDDWTTPTSRQRKQGPRSPSRPKKEDEKPKFTLKPNTPSPEADESIKTSRKTEEASESDRKRRRKDGKIQSLVEVDGRRRKVYWTATGKENVDLDLRRKEYSSQFNSIVEDNAKGKERKPFITWWMPNSDLTDQKDMVRVNVRPHAKHDYIKFPPYMADWVKTTVIRYNDDPGWYISRERAPIGDTEHFEKDPEDIDVVLIFALPPRYWVLDDNKQVTNVAF